MEYTVSCIFEQAKTCEEQYTMLQAYLHESINTRQSYVQDIRSPAELRRAVWSDNRFAEWKKVVRAWNSEKWSIEDCFPMLLDQLDATKINLAKLQHQAEQLIIIMSDKRACFESFHLATKPGTPLPADYSEWTIIKQVIGPQLPGMSIVKPTEMEWRLNRVQEELCKLTDNNSLHEIIREYVERTLKSIIL